MCWALDTTRPRSVNGCWDWRRLAFSKIGPGRVERVLIAVALLRRTSQEPMSTSPAEPVEVAPTGLQYRRYILGHPHIRSSRRGPFVVASREPRIPIPPSTTAHPFTPPITMFLSTATVAIAAASAGLVSAAPLADKRADGINDGVILNY